MTYSCISPREKEVLDLIADENSTKMIAKELFISEHTVITHRKNLMIKLNASNAAGLVRKAYESGVLNLSRQVALFVLIALSVSSVQAQQSLEYEFDPNYLSITRDKDTILHTTTGNMLSNINLRIQEPGETSFVAIRPRINGVQDNPGIVFVQADGTQALRLVTNFNSTGDARVITDEVEITGGSDLAELFEITNQEREIVPGYLVSLDPTAPGKLKISNEPYDKKIAGIISGANGIKPGILMGQDDTMATGDDLVTLSGRTYVMANTSNGDIKIGDMITTSSVAGQAMKATHKKKSRGAIIGKAMTELEDGSGFILVLVNLQ